LSHTTIANPHAKIRLLIAAVTIARMVARNFASRPCAGGRHGAQKTANASDAKVSEDPRSHLLIAQVDPVQPG